MDLETHMQKYHGKARDGGYAVTFLHVTTKVAVVDDEALGHHKSKPKLSDKAFSWPNSGCSSEGW